MITNSMIAEAATNDADLVNATLAGSRDAFGQIVSRYQSLICSLAYSATGSLGQSEDLAQETFITAWKHLGHLREREKLRSWLCGIARNRINGFLRREGREPIREAQSLDNAAESRSPEPLPVDYTISREEESILWRSLERIPETYREPLILFYREHQSVETVADQLGLSEDAVHQRLSRGRKLLQEQVLAFVEGALARTNPGKAFTLGILAALPALTVSSKAAVVGAAAAKGSAAAKGAGILGLLGALLTPLLVVFANYASYRMNMNEAHSDEERKYIKATFSKSLWVTLVLSAIIAVPLLWICGSQGGVWLSLGMVCCETVVMYFLVLAGFVLAGFRQRRRYLASVLADRYSGEFPESAFEYQSRWRLLGLPLIHVRLGDRFDVLRPPVKAWIAIGSSHAVGVIFASGGLAIAPISFGGIAIGILPFGAIAAGLFSLGAVSLGIWAYGGLAVGWQVFCGCGIAWNAAEGGLAMARDFAVGGIVHALQANTDAAQQFIRQSPFFQLAGSISKHSLLVNLAWVIPVTLQSWVVSRARRRREQMNQQPTTH